VTRVCVIGGGSAYMPGIAYAFARLHDRFPEPTLVLSDIDAEALELQTRLTRSIMRSRGASDVRVEAASSRAEAIEGADLVLTAFRPGGLEARHLDESIATRHGIVGQETAGPGGFAMALRSIPILMDIAKEVRATAAPDAVILNYTNPVQIVTEALTRYADVPFLGLCDQTRGEIAFLARLLRADPREMELDTCGVNHMTFTRAVRVGTEEVTEDLWHVLRRIELTELETEEERRIVRLFRVLGVVPSEYMEYFFFHDEVLAEQRAKGRTRAEEVIAILPDVLESYRREADAEYPRPSMARASEGHGDFAVSLMAAMVSGADARFILNVPNRGAIEGLQNDAVVETPCRVKGRHVQAIAQGPLPSAVAGLVAQVAEHARLSAEAAVTGDRELAVRALLAHPLVRSLDVAERLVDAYLGAHARHVPQFAAGSRALS
jgi:6-phospho-beta-glucosidase